MKALHEEIIMDLEDSNLKYKHNEDKQRRHRSFEIGDEVMINLNKNRFLVDTYSKVKMKNFGPCKIQRKFDSGNYFEVELPGDMDILPIFNIVDIF